MKCSILVLLLFCLSGCVSKEGKKFIENPETQTQAKYLVEKTLMDNGVQVTANSDNVFYKPIGKGGELEDKIIVNYKTKSKPIYSNRAIVQVDLDSKPRKLKKVVKNGIISKYDYDLYDHLIGHVFPFAYRTSLSKIRTFDDFPALHFEEHSSVNDGIGLYVRIDLDKEKLNESKMNALFTYYMNNDLENPSEVLAKKIIDELMILNVGEEGKLTLPKISIHYSYNGVFSNDKMDALLDNLLLIDGLPLAIYSISIDAEDFEVESKKNRKKYNADVYGTLHPKFNGYLKIDENNRLKNTINIFNY